MLAGVGYGDHPNWDDERREEEQEEKKKDES